jgi:hypothetical protein
MEIRLPLPVNQLELLLHLIKERASNNMSNNNSDLSQARITTKWVTREVAEPSYIPLKNGTNTSISNKENAHVNGHKGTEKPTILLEKRRKEAQIALADGKQELSLKIISEILADVESQYGDERTIEKAHENYILTMAQCNRLGKLFNNASITVEQYALESAKLNGVIQNILDQVEHVIQQVSKNTRQVVEFEIPTNQELDAQDLLSMIYEIADKLGIKKEEVIPVSIKD